MAQKQRRLLKDSQKRSRCLSINTYNTDNYVCLKKKKCAKQFLMIHPFWNLYGSEKLRSKTFTGTVSNSGPGYWTSPPGFEFSHLISPNGHQKSGSIREECPVMGMDDGHNPGTRLINWLFPLQVESVSRGGQREARRISSPSSSTISLFLQGKNPLGLGKSKPLNAKLVKFTVLASYVWESHSALHLGAFIGQLTATRESWTRWDLRKDLNKNAGQAMD